MNGNAQFWFDSRHRLFNVVVKTNIMMVRVLIMNSEYPIICVKCNHENKEDIDKIYKISKSRSNEEQETNYIS